MSDVIDAIIRTWKDRLCEVHPMVFDGVENSRKNFLLLVEEYRKDPVDSIRQTIEMLLGSFEIASLGWQLEDADGNYFDSEVSS